MVPSDGGGWCLCGDIEIDDGRDCWQLKLEVKRETRRLENERRSEVCGFSDGVRLEQDHSEKMGTVVHIRIPDVMQWIVHNEPLKHTRWA